MNPFVKLAFEAAGLNKLAGTLSNTLIGAGVGSLGMTGAAAIQDKPLDSAFVRGAGVGAAMGGGPALVNSLLQKSKLLKPHSETFARFVPALGLVPLIAADDYSKRVQDPDQ